jgi:hypothetical protein
MTEGHRDELSDRLGAISVELREIEFALRSGTTPDVMRLQEFRHVLDTARLTAWTVSETLNAVETQRDPANVLSFVAAERLRRSNQMLKDLCADIDHEDITWQAGGIRPLFDTVNSLQVQLRKLVEEHRSRLATMCQTAK